MNWKSEKELRLFRNWVEYLEETKKLKRFGITQTSLKTNSNNWYRKKKLEADSDTNCGWSLCNSPNRSGKKTIGTGDWMQLVILA